MNAQRIETGTAAGDALGFVASLYSGWLEMRDHRRLYLHFIISRKKNGGNTQALISDWIARGYDVRVVMPRPIMQHILEKFQFVPYRESLPDWYEGIVEIWRRPKVQLRSGLPGKADSFQGKERLSISSSINSRGQRYPGYFCV